VTAARVLLVLGAVALRAVFRRELQGDLEAPVVLGLLALDGVMTIEAVHAGGRVSAALELGHDGRGLVAVTPGALARGLRELSRRLAGLHLRAAAVHDDGSRDQRGSQEDGDED
jgi:hypothetical protein